MLIAPKFAHEVYVLTSQQISHDKHTRSPNVFQALSNSHDLRLFIIFSVLAVAILALLLFLKSTTPFKRLGGFIDKATVIAPDVIRIAFGVSLIISAKNNAVFGPELPISSFPLHALLRIALMVIGVALTLGIFIRLFSWLAVLLCLFVFAVKGWYMLTYTNYLGEAIAVVLLPVQKISLDWVVAKLKWVKFHRPKYEQYSMPVARLLFGFSLLYAAINVKFVTSALSLDVVNRYNLTHYFPFDPLFLVLLAGFVEILIAVLYILGLLQRFNTIFFLIFLTLSLFFFKESVWPHYLLIALGIGIFLHKPDIWALDRYLFSGRKYKKTPS